MAFQYQYPIVPVSIYLELFVLEVIIVMLRNLICYRYWDIFKLVQLLCLRRFYCYAANLFFYNIFLKRLTNVYLLVKEVIAKELNRLCLRKQELFKYILAFCAYASISFCATHIVLAYAYCSFFFNIQPNCYAYYVCYATLNFFYIINPYI